MILERVCRMKQIRVRFEPDSSLDHIEVVVRAAQEDEGTNKNQKCRMDRQKGTIHEKQEENPDISGCGTSHCGESLMRVSVRRLQLQ